MPAEKRIVLTTFGSPGDLHPYIAIALGLKERGFHPVLATSPYYRAKIEAEQIEFAPIRPDFKDRDEVKRLVRDVMDLKRGPEVVIRDIMLPHLRDSYNDYLAAIQTADLIITHPLTYAAPIAAQVLKKPWVLTVLQPALFFSEYDELEIAPALWLTAVRHKAPGVYRWLLRALKRSTRSWARPIDDLRRDVGLPASQGHPLFEGQYSPFANFALFSRVLGQQQPDWPADTRITGFPFYDHNGENALDPALERFLQAGPPPIVFTLGSSAVMDAGRFYQESAEAALKLGVRALLLIGDEPENRPAGPLPDSIAAFSYAPYSQVFPRCAVVVHQGGVGTTGQALRAGRPMLIMPYAHDQPDNAARIVRLGVGRTVPRARYNAAAAVTEIRPLLEDSRFSERAAAIGKQVQTEDGVRGACDAIEEVLARN